MKWTLSTLVSMTLAAIVVLGCDSGKDEKKGRSLNIPPIEPPVTEATPAGLDAAAQALRLGLAQSCGSETGTPIERLQARLFCPGPGDFRNRLSLVDERMREIDLRAIDNLPVCVDDETKTWTPALPTGESFPMHFFCYEPMVDEGTPPEDAELRVFFGQNEGYSYLAELQVPSEEDSHDSAAIAVMARVDDSGDVVEFWQVSWQRDDDTSSWMNVKADRETETFEFIAAGTTTGFGAGCGVNVRANAELLYLRGVISDPGFPGGCDNTDDGWNDIELNIDLCLDAENLEEVAMSQCSDANLTEFSVGEYTAADVVGWDDDELQKSVVSGVGMPAGIRAFTESYLPIEGEE